MEREWSGHATGPHARFAGVRTFFLLGGIGGVAGWALDTGAPLVAGALLLATGALVVAAYLAAAGRGGGGGQAIDGTTETAALLVLGIGVVAGMGLLRLASGCVAVMVLVLGEKAVIREFVSRIGKEEMRAALQFAVLALVVLPLLPAGPIERLWGMQPRALWAVVLIFSGLNFAGYITRRALGESRGYPVMGAVGGLVSSTLMTLNFSRRSRAEPASSTPLAIGTVAACTILALRILGLTLILNPALLERTALGLAPTLLAGVLMLLLAWKHLRGGKAHPAAAEQGNPLRLRSAILMALSFQLVLVLLHTLTKQFGQSGVLASATILGLTDMDALTFGMNRLAEAPEMVPLAALAITLGVTVNCVVKTAIAGIVGGSGYRRLALPGLLLLTAAGGVGIWVLRMLQPAG